MKSYNIITFADDCGSDVNETDIYQEMAEIFDEYNPNVKMSQVEGTLFAGLYDCFLAQENEERENCKDFIAVNSFKSMAQLDAFIKGIELSDNAYGYETNWCKCFCDLKELRKNLLKRKVLIEKTLKIFKK